jgi:predicted Fe-Mo cluster-binding NifX family protein
MKEVIPSPGHQPGFLPAWLAEEEVSVIIAGGMGSRAQALLKENCVEVVAGRPIPSNLFASMGNK